MKKILSILLFLLSLLPLPTFAYVNVKGYYKSNGTYVAPYVRSNPNGLKYDNYSYKPSQGLYNLSYGTKGVAWDTPTYLTDTAYYQGKSIYENTNTSLQFVNPVYVSPVYDSSSLFNSLYSNQPAKYTASVAPSINQLSGKPKERATVSYIVKYWADSNPLTVCNDSTFLNSIDIILCNDYRNNYDKYDWITSNFQPTENYALYNNQFYSCLGKTKIQVSTNTKPVCVEK